MELFHAYLLYLSIKFHFNQEKYDYFKYNGKLKNSSLFDQQKFLDKNESHLYIPLSRHKEPEKLLVANFIQDSSKFILDITSDIGYNILESWKIRQISLYYNLEQEIDQFDRAKDLLNINFGLPKLLEKYIAKDVSPESIVLIDSVIHKLDSWQKLNHPLVQNNILKLRKYRSFYKPNEEKIRKIFERKWK